MSQSISNHTHACLFPSTPQRSEIVSTMGKPHPPLRSERGLGSEGILKPGPGSHTLPRTAPSETVTVSEIWSSAESPAWRMLLVTSSLTTSRTSSSFSGGKRSVSWIQGMARGRDDLRLVGQSQIDLSYHQKATGSRPALQALCTLGHVSLHVSWLCCCSIGERKEHKLD